MNPEALELTGLVIVVRGGAGALPPPGTVFSGAVGETLEEEAAYVPHGTIRFTTVAAILAAGGSVTLQPEITRSGKLNERHVNVMEVTSLRYSQNRCPILYLSRIGCSET
jgi:hypothetical protein